MLVWCCNKFVLYLFDVIFSFILLIMNEFAARYGFVSALPFFFKYYCTFVQKDLSLFVLPCIAEVSMSLCIGLYNFVSVDGILGTEFVLFGFHIYIYFIDGSLLMEFTIT